MKYLSIIPAILFIVSCSSSPSPKSYGAITSDTAVSANIDTTCGNVRPITNFWRLYTLTNKSKEHKVTFTCKAFVEDYSKTFERSETHVLAPKQEVQLEIDSSFYTNLVKYEIVDANITSN
ncbi:hypothetical protein [Mucilaginibacter pankratovii]|uniref:hypothetical protein n=1 Tax=Mucilaginibacter pankratovii TaxID=2772110 RepID=UPI0017474514|nr:hypothetical protein [Mucilaginibacter pankratovii]